MSGRDPAASFRRLNLPSAGENVDGPEAAARAGYATKYTADWNYQMLMEIYQRVLETQRAA